MASDAGNARPDKSRMFGLDMSGKVLSQRQLYVQLFKATFDALFFTTVVSVKVSVYARLVSLQKASKKLYPL